MVIKVPVINNNKNLEGYLTYICSTPSDPAVTSSSASVTIANKTKFLPWFSLFGHKAMICNSTILKT